MVKAPVVLLITVHSLTMAGKIKFRFAVSVPVMTMIGLPYCKGVNVTFALVIVTAVTPLVKSGTQPAAAAPAASGSVVLFSTVLNQ